MAFDIKTIDYDLIKLNIDKLKIIMHHLLNRGYSSPEIYKLLYTADPSISKYEYIFEILIAKQWFNRVQSANPQS